MTAEKSQIHLVASLGLSANDYSEVAKLAKFCNDYDQITLKVNDFMLQSRPRAEINDFLCSIGGELVGYLGIYQFNGREIEISGMVHPTHRRKGIFTSLLNEAKEEIAQRNIRKLIFINAENSIAGKQFLDSIGAVYSFSEYWMKYINTGDPINEPIIQLRTASSSDLPFLAHALAAGFQMDEFEEVESLTNDTAGAERLSNRRVIELSGIQIGTISVNHPTEERAFFFGFTILPEYQGHGYGKQALSVAIQEAKNDNRTLIELEVACENKNALRLYESCGFKVQRANDYYVLIPTLR